MNRVHTASRWPTESMRRRLARARTNIAFARAIGRIVNHVSVTEEPDIPDELIPLVKVSVMIVALVDTDK